MLTQKELYRDIFNRLIILTDKNAAVTKSDTHLLLILCGNLILTWTEASS